MKAVSKSQFVLSLQCEKAFWLYRHQKDLLKHTKAQEKIMQSWTDFGVLMQGLFPGGVDVSQVALVPIGLGLLLKHLKEMKPRL